MGADQKHQLQVSRTAGTPTCTQHWPEPHQHKAVVLYLQLWRSPRPPGTCAVGCGIANMPITSLHTASDALLKVLPTSTQHW